MSTSCVPEHPAKGSAMPEDEEDWTIHVLVSHSPLSLLSMIADRHGSFGRTFQAASRQIKGETLDPSSEHWMKSGILSRGEFLTLNTSDHSRSPSQYLSEESVCSLSDILTSDVPQEFYLTPRACAGIHNRFERAGKLGKLPKRFRGILERMTMEYLLS